MVSCIGTAVNAITGNDVATRIGGTHADVHDIGIGWCNSNGAYGSRFDVVVREVFPGQASIGGFPDAPSGCTHVKGVGFLAHAFNSGRATSPTWAYEAKLQGF